MDVIVECELLIQTRLSELQAAVDECERLRQALAAFAPLTPAAGQAESRTDTAEPAVAGADHDRDQDVTADEVADPGEPAERWTTTFPRNGEI